MSDISGGAALKNSMINPSAAGPVSRTLKVNGPESSYEKYVSSEWLTLRSEEKVDTTTSLPKATIATSGPTT